MPKKSISSAKSKQKIINPVTTSKPIKFSSEDLVSQANVALSNMQFELAVKFYKRALQMAPTDTSIMDALAEVQIQLGETHEAELMLQQSISLEPTRNPYKWCYLAQLQNGEQAFISYKKAAEIMSSTIDTLTDEVIHIIYFCSFITFIFF